MRFISYLRFAFLSLAPSTIFIIVCTTAQLSSVHRGEFEREVFIITMQSCWLVNNMHGWLQQIPQPSIRFCTRVRKLGLTVPPFCAEMFSTLRNCISITVIVHELSLSRVQGRRALVIHTPPSTTILHRLSSGSTLSTTGDIFSYLQQETEQPISGKKDKSCAQGDLQDKLSALLMWISQFFSGRSCKTRDGPFLNWTFNLVHITLLKGDWNFPRRLAVVQSLHWENPDPCTNCVWLARTFH